MSDTPTMLQDRLASMAHAFDDEGRKYAARLLAADVGKLEQELNDAHHTIESLRASLRELVGLLEGSAAQNALQRARDLLP